MSANTDTILDNLSYLRRYARALTGSQRAGDNYVRACLETMLEEPQRMKGAYPKRDVFRLFHEVWQALRSPPETKQGSGNANERQRVAHGLAALPPVERMVLLLTALEAFSVADTAFILDMDEEDVRATLKRARDDIEMRASVDILIIEDEPIIAMELSRIVVSMGHKVCGVAAREQEALALAIEKAPALVLADIQLKDGDSGISAVRNILTKLEMPVIFVTGFPERLLTGNTLEPAFVISKPFDPDMLRTVIGQALTVAPASDNDRPKGAAVSA